MDCIRSTTSWLWWSWTIENNSSNNGNKSFFDKKIGKKTIMRVNNLLQTATSRNLQTLFHTSFLYTPAIQSCCPTSMNERQPTELPSSTSTPCPRRIHMRRWAHAHSIQTLQQVSNCGCALRKIFAEKYQNTVNKIESTVNAIKWILALL